LRALSWWRALVGHPRTGLRRGRPGIATRAVVPQGDRGWGRAILFRGFDDLVVKQVEGGAQHNPLNAVLVPFSQRLPDCFLFGGFACNADAGAATTAIRPGRVLLDLAKFDALGRDVMACISEIEHRPEACVRIRLRYLEEGEIGGVGGGQGELVNGRDDARIGYGPLEVPGRFTAHDPRVASRSMAGVGCGCLCGVLGPGREELGYAKVALR